MPSEIKPRYVSKEELVDSLREVVTVFNDLNETRIGLVLFGSRARETNGVDSDVDLFHFHCGDSDEYIKPIRMLDLRIDNLLFKFGIVSPFFYRVTVLKKWLLSSLEDEAYRRELLMGRLGLLDKYSLYIGPDEEENNCLLERALELSSREPYSLRW